MKRFFFKFSPENIKFHNCRPVTADYPILLQLSRKAQCCDIFLIFLLNITCSCLKWYSPPWRRYVWQMLWARRAILVAKETLSCKWAYARRFDAASLVSRLDSPMNDEERQNERHQLQHAKVEAVKPPDVPAVVDHRPENDSETSRKTNSNWITIRLDFLKKNNNN